MKKMVNWAIVFLIIIASTAFIPTDDNEEIKSLSPKNYLYTDAKFCLTCKTEGNAIMPRAIGVSVNGKELTPDGKGWLASAHAKAHSHQQEINSYCAKCHFPTYDKVTLDKDKGEAIPEGQWQGVTCRACHSSNLERTLRKSTLINYKPGQDKSSPQSYVFIDKKDGKAQNSQCLFCHTKGHTFKIDVKNQMMADGDLKCIDCHMAAYQQEQYTLARFHNMKVEENLPWSCGSKLGNNGSCHVEAEPAWMKESLKNLY